ncbi:MAG: hypothetical protein JRD89_03485 [Deltaproteobacteria bacterium]|nr:hypothetical protein [Deltaproteobacteria bacterium]
MRTMQEAEEIAKFVQQEYSVRCFTSDVTDAVADSPPWIQVDTNGFMAAYQGPCNDRFDSWLRGFESGYHHCLARQKG